MADIMERVEDLRREIGLRQRDGAQAQVVLDRAEGRLAAAEEELERDFGVTSPDQYATREAELAAAAAAEAARIEELLAQAGGGDGA